MLRVSGGNNYELKRGILIKHVGLPMYAGSNLITPFKIVWWWPVNWFVGLYILSVEILKDLKK